jgi:hypothetical protein
MREKNRNFVFFPIQIGAKNPAPSAGPRDSLFSYYVAYQRVTRKRPILVKYLHKKNFRAIRKRREKAKFGSAF